MNNDTSLQNSFLAELRDSGDMVSIYLVNGIKLHGTIDKFDDTTITLKSTVTQMIFKHAVSTVVPSESFKTTG